MDRRTFISGTVLGLVSVPLATAAQQAETVPRVGMLLIGSPSGRPGRGSDAFMKQLGELGWIEGRKRLTRSLRPRAAGE